MVMDRSELAVEPEAGYIVADVMFYIYIYLLYIPDSVRLELIGDRTQ